MSLQGTIITSLTAFKKTIKEYNDLVKQNTSPEEKHVLRLTKFQDDLEQFNSKFESLRLQRETLLQAESHLELMGRRHISTDNPYDESQRANQQSAGPLLQYLEGLYKEKQSLSRGNQQLDMILEMGQNAFDGLVDQNETLRRVGQTFEQSLMTLGVSRGTIRRVERRARQDKWIFWGAVVVMFVMCYYIVRWFH